MSTPTKAAEIREALAKAQQRLLNDNAGKPRPYHDALDDINDALSLLADLDGGGEVAKDVMPTYDAGLLSDYGGGNVEWWQDYLRAELNRADDFYQNWWQSSHPSPTAADAPPEAESRKPVDVAEVIKAGDAMRERLFDITEGNIHAGRIMPKYNADTFAMTVDWTNATKPFRP